MRFPGIRLVEQTEQKFRRFESVLKKTSDCNSRALLLIKAPTQKGDILSFLKIQIVAKINQGALWRIETFSKEV